jgi:NAD(P)H-dependent FMN reductase
MKIALIYGSVRSHRKGIKAVRFVEKHLDERKMIYTTLDPKEWDLPMLDLMYKEMENPEEKFQKLHNILEDADGYLIVSGEYNHGVPPALKNFLDHFQTEYYFKPSAIVSYSRGRFGGVRAAEQLRSICAELGMPAISSSFAISKINESINEDGTVIEGEYDKRIGKFLDEFEWYLEAFKNQREKSTPY